MSLKEWLRLKFNEIFVDNFPLDALKDLPVRLMYIMGSLSYLLLVAVFIILFYTGYLRAVNQKFMSLQQDAGNCNVVTKHVDGTFVGTSDGYWTGSRRFRPQNGMYSMSFSNAVLTKPQYSALMASVESQLAAVEAGSYDRDAAENLMYWMQWKVSTHSVLFQMAASPVRIFDRQRCFFAMARREGPCLSAADTAGVDVANAQLQVSYQRAAFENSTACVHSLNPLLLGYVPEVHSEVIRLEFDVNSFTVCIAVSIIYPLL
jgi:hypothetical protein